MNTYSNDPIWIQDGPYNHNVKPPKVAPHCNCIGVHKYYGLKAGSTIRNGSGLDKPTILGDDGTCRFCEHDVLWKLETWDGRTKRGNRAKEN